MHEGQEHGREGQIAAVGPCIEREQHVPARAVRPLDERRLLAREAQDDARFPGRRELGVARELDRLEGAQLLFLEARQDAARTQVGQVEEALLLLDDAAQPRAPHALEQLPVRGFGGVALPAQDGEAAPVAHELAQDLRLALVEVRVGREDDDLDAVEVVAREARGLDLRQRQGRTPLVPGREGPRQEERPPGVPRPRDKEHVQLRQHREHEVTHVVLGQAVDALAHDARELRRLAGHDRELVRLLRPGPEPQAGLPLRLAVQVHLQVALGGHVGRVVAHGDREPHGLVAQDGARRHLHPLQAHVHERLDLHRHEGDARVALLVGQVGVQAVEVGAREVGDHVQLAVRFGRLPQRLQRLVDGRGPAGRAVSRLQVLDALPHQRQVVDRRLEVRVRGVVEGHQVHLVAALEHVEEPLGHPLGGLERGAVLPLRAHAVARVQEQHHARARLRGQEPREAAAHRGAGHRERREHDDEHPQHEQEQPPQVEAAHALLVERCQEAQVAELDALEPPPLQQVDDDGHDAGGHPGQEQRVQEGEVEHRFPSWPAARVDRSARAAGSAPRARAARRPFSPTGCACSGTPGAPGRRAWTSSPGRNRPAARGTVAPGRASTRRRAAGSPS